MGDEKVTGTIVEKDGGYFLKYGSPDVPRKTEMIALDDKVDRDILKATVGSAVDVVFSEPQRFVAGIMTVENQKLRVPWRILCYIPPPDIPYRNPAIDPAQTKVIVNTMIKSGYLTEKTGAAILEANVKATMYNNAVR